MKTFGILSAIFLILFCNCSPELNIHQMYQQAVADAVFREPSEISDNLTEINDENEALVWKIINDKKYLLVVSWMKENDTKSIPPPNSTYNAKEDIWVTVVPELQTFIYENKPQNNNRRLQQLLGLPPNAEYQNFVEFWVKPSDLFRPCPDSEINDNHCVLCFPENADSSHISWINANRLSSYYNCELYDNYPWTQLGYTYDWSPENKTHFGLSEFVIKQSSIVFINRIYTTDEYLP